MRSGRDRMRKGQAHHKDDDGQEGTVIEEVLAPFLQRLWPWRRVPDVVGRPAREAYGIMVAADLEPAGISEESDRPVLRQDPPAGTRVRKAITVTLTPG